MRVITCAILVLLLLNANSLNAQSQGNSVPSEKYYIPTPDQIAYSPQNLRSLLGLPVNYQFGQERTTTYNPTCDYVRISQLVNGYRVVGGELIVQVDNGFITKVVNHYRNVENVSSTVYMPEETILDILKDRLDGTVLVWNDVEFPSTQSELVYYPVQDRLELAHKVRLFVKDIDKIYYLSAFDGDELSVVESIHTCNTPGTCQTTHSGTQQIFMSQNGSDFNLDDCSVLPTPGFTTVNALGLGYSEDGEENAVPYSSTSSDWVISDPASRTGLDVHWGTKEALEYLDEYGLTPVPSLGLINYANWDNGFNNAQINPSANPMWTKYAGDNIGLTTIDVVGHELGHAVCRFQSEDGIIQGGDEPGSLQEAVADIIGTLVQYNSSGNLDWIMADLLSIRDMSNPGNQGHPDTYLGVNWYGGTNQSALVHTNNGIINYWFYLISEGGSGTNDFGNYFDISPIGISNSESLIFWILNGGLTFDSDFEEFREVSLIEAGVNFGFCSPEYESVYNAWYAVNLGPISNGQSPITGLATLDITNCTAFLEWSEGAYDNYIVSYRENAGVWQTVESLNNEHYLIGLNPESNYEWYITPYCSGTAYAQSETVQFQTSDECPTPFGIVLNENTFCSAELSWNSTSSQTNFTVYYREAGSSDSPNVVSLSQTTLLIEGLVIDTQYECWIETNCGGTCPSASSAIFLFNTAGDDLPDIDLQSQATDCQILSTWNSVSDLGLYKVLLRYSEVPLGTGSGALLPPTYVINNTSNFLNGFDEGQTIYVTLYGRYICEAETLDVVLGQAETIRPFVSGTCGEPSNLDLDYYINGAGWGISCMSWTSPLSGFYKYEVQRWEDGDWTEPYFAQQPYLYVSTNGDVPCRRFRVRTECKCIGDPVSTFSPWVEYEECPPCDPDEVLAISDICTENVTVEHFKSNFAITRQIELWDGVEWQEVEVDYAPNLFNQPPHYFTIIGLSQGSNYSVRIRTQCDSGEETLSNEFSFSTSGGCQSPSNIQVTSIADNTATLTWDPPLGGAEFYEYRYAVVEPSPVWASQQVFANQTTIGGLDFSNFDYYFQVRAFCAECNSSDFSTSITISQCDAEAAITSNDNCAPSTSQTLTVNTTGLTGVIEYNWTDPENNTFNGQVISSTGAGEYEVIATDQNDCSAIAYFNVLEGLSVSVATTSSCPVNPNGSIVLSVFGGQEPYSFSWSHDPGETLSQVFDLESGNYEVTVSDGQGCSVTESISIGYDTSVPAMNMFEDVVVIDSDIDWPAGTFGFIGGVSIINDATLTFVNGTTLRFANNVGIDVEAGCTVHINSGVLATRFECSDSYWKGIDLEGATANSASPTPATAAIAQSTIQYAKIGVETNAPNFGGIANKRAGVIIGHQATFLDCQRAIKMRGHDFTNPSYLKGCYFKWTEDLPYLDIFNPHPLVDLYKVTFDMYSCEFENTNEDILSSTVNQAHRPAIYAYGARLVMSGDVIWQNRSNIKGFRHGLVQYGGRTYMDKYDLNNFRSAYVKSSKGSRFTSNEFGLLSETELPILNVNTDEFSYKTMFGLYLDNSSAYWIEDNDYFMAWPGNDPNVPPAGNVVPYKAGMFVRSSGPAQNEIYRNRFYNADDATIAYDDNRNEDTEDASGLKYSCNEFYDNGYALNVVSTVNDNNEGWGIHINQGVAEGQGGQLAMSAGNYFEGQTVKDLRNDANLGHVTYFWNPADTENGFVPTYVDNDNLELPLQPEQFMSCPSRLDRTRSTRSAEADIDKQATEQYRIQYQSLVDGGDTEGLMTEVGLTQYGEALELYYELMSKSPNLSEAVMIEAIQKETELPAALLTLILESNPQAAKSKEVEKKLDDRMMPLEEYQRYMIEQGKQIMSSKELIASRIAYHESRQHAALDAIIVDIMMDSTVVDKRAEIDAQVIGRESLDIRYLRIDLAIEDGDLTAAQSLLDNIPNDIELRGLKDQEYADFVACYEMLIDLLIAEPESLTAAQQDQLYTIALKNSTRASGMAEIMLVDYAGYLIDEVLVDPLSTQKSNRNWNPQKPKFSTDPSLHLYPNPSTDHVVLEFRNWGSVILLELRDALGRVIRNEEIVSTKTAHVLDVSGLSPGTYTLKLHSIENALIDSRQIEITR